MNRGDLKKYLIPFAAAVAVFVSIRPAIFTWDLVMANYQLWNKGGSSGDHIYNTLRVRPSIYRVYKKYKQSGIDNVIVKQAIYSKYNNDIDIFPIFEKYDGELALSYFENTFKDNFYFRYLFSPGPDGSGEIQGNWKNLDAVALHILADPAMNPLTLSLWEKMKFPSSIDSKFAANLSDYCLWKGNKELGDILVNKVKQKMGETGIKEIDPSLMNGYDSRTSFLYLVEILKEKNRLTSGDFSGNLLDNGDFNGSIDRFNREWYLSKMAGYGTFPDGSFTMGLDSCESRRNRFLRIMGFFAERVPGKGKARGGAWAREKIKIQTGYYLFSFDYLTKTGKERGSFYLWKGINEIHLPETGGKWKKAIYFLNNADGKHTVLKPLFRMWGTGTVSIDNVYLARVTHPRFAFRAPGVFYLEEWK